MLTRGDKHEGIPPIYFKMKNFGFQIQDKIDEIAQLGEEKFALRNLIQYAADNVDDPILQDLVLRSHELGYMLGEIIHNLHVCHRGEMHTSIEDLRIVLIENDITPERIQEGYV